MASMPRYVRTIVLAAGNSQRFKDIGIQIPKGLIRFNGKTMIEHVCTDLPELTDITVAVNGLFFGELPQNIECIPIQNSRGQAETLKMCLESITPARSYPVLVLNCDVGYRYPLSTFVQQAQEFPSAALVFLGYGETAFSYVNDFPLFSAAYEKTPISSWAMAGAYYFQDCQKLLTALTNQLNFTPTYNGEFYLSGTYHHLGGGGDIGLAVAMERNQLLQYGTPEDLARNPDLHFDQPQIKELLGKVR